MFFFYFIFVNFRLFPVFDMGLAHYGSEPFNCGFHNSQNIKLINTCSVQKLPGSAYGKYMKGLILSVMLLASFPGFVCGKPEYEAIML